MNRREQGTLLRFAVVGAGVALCYVLLYLGFQALGLAQSVANVLAFLIAVSGQYVAQTTWTFRRPLALPSQVGRFVVTIGLGLLVSALITGSLGPMLGWADWLAAAVVTVVLPVQNYLFFRNWVFSEPGVSVE